MSETSRLQIRSLRELGIPASDPINVAGTSHEEIRRWLDRHLFDDDPPKIAVAYVKLLLDELEYKGE